MDPKVRAIVNDLTGEIIHEGVNETVPSVPLMDRECRDTMIGCERLSLSPYPLF